MADNTPTPNTPERGASPEHEPTPENQAPGAFGPGAASGAFRSGNAGPGAAGAGPAAGAAPALPPWPAPESNVGVPEDYVGSAAFIAHSSIALVSSMIGPLFFFIPTPRTFPHPALFALALVIVGALTARIPRIYRALISVVAVMVWSFHTYLDSLFELPIIDLSTTVLPARIAEAQAAHPILYPVYDVLTYALPAVSGAAVAAAISTLFPTVAYKPAPDPARAHATRTPLIVPGESFLQPRIFLAMLPAIATSAAIVAVLAQGNREYVLIFLTWIIAPGVIALHTAQRGSRRLFTGFAIFGSVVMVFLVFMRLYPEVDDAGFPVVTFALFTVLFAYPAAIMQFAGISGLVAGVIPARQRTRTPGAHSAAS